MSWNRSLATGMHPEADLLRRSLQDKSSNTFRLSEKQCVIFVNSKTCYSVASIFERQIPDINLWFEEVLVEQLIDDFKLSETVEASIRRELAQIRICRSNNNRTINGTVRDILEYLRFFLEYAGTLKPGDEPAIAALLNGRPTAAKVQARNKGEFYSADDGMKRLIEIHARSEL